MPRPLPALLATTVAVAAIAVRALAPDVLAQPPRHAHAAHAAPADSLSATARAQLDSARRATAPLATPEAARAAGYRPMFGHVPLQGEHYVRVDLVASDSFDLAHPSVLMFAPVRGAPTLVGVAYAYLHPAGAEPPRGFDGEGDAWHAHPGLAHMPGRELVMTHAWFVDAPEGPFARYNPWLPYLAVGLAPPSAAALGGAAGERERRLAMALAVASTPPMLFAWIERAGGASLQEAAARHRAAVASLVPRLAAAERAGDAALRARLAADVTRAGDALVTAYRGAVRDRPLAARLVDRTVDEFLGRGHGIEEELGALFGGEPPHDVNGAHHDRR